MIDAPTHKPTVFPIISAMSALALVCAAAAGIVGGAAMGMGYPAHARLNVIAALVCGGAGLVGLLPVWALSRSSPHGAAYGFLAGILLRMIVAGGAVLAAQWWWRWPDAAAFAMWVAGWYLLVLVLEVRLVSAHVVRRPDAPKRVVPTGGVQA